MLSYSATRTRAVLGALPDPLVVLDDQGAASFVSPRLATLLDVDVDAVVGRAASEWCPVPEVARLLDAEPGARRGRSVALTFEPPGRAGRTVELTVHPIPAGDGAPPGAVAVFRDLTHDVAARKAQAEFLAHMAHELKSPLHVLLLTSENLEGPMGAEEESRLSACNLMRSEVERTRSLIDTLFSIARIEMGAFEIDRQRVRLAPLLEEAAQAAARVDPGIRVDTAIAPNLPDVWVDKALVRVAVDNVLSNAIKYNRPEGEVQVRAERDGEGVAIEIADTGLGIEERDLERIFEKFYRAEDAATRKREGHGLGLSLVREILHLHGGQVRVESEPGVGTRFRLVFPDSPMLFQESAR